MFPETPILWNEARPSTGPHSTLPLRNAQGCSLSAARIFTCSETQRPGMTSHYAARIGGPAGTDLAECRLGLFGEQPDDMGGAVAAERTEPPQEGLAREGRLRAERERARHVGAAADAGIHQHGGAARDLLDDGRQGVDRGRQRLDLAPAMVRHHEAVNAERKRGRGIVRMEDALEHQRPFPAIAIARDLLPREGALDLAAGEFGDLGEAAATRIGTQVGKTRDAVAQHGGEPAPARLRCPSTSRDRAGTAW